MDFSATTYGVFPAGVAKWYGSSFPSYHSWVRIPSPTLKNKIEVNVILRPPIPSKIGGFYVPETRRK
jgi:hypothetical protein